MATASKPADPGQTARMQTMSRAPVETTTAVVVLCPGYHGHGVARTLGRLGVRVYGVHQDRASPAARSRYWTRNFVWDLAHAPQYATVDWLLELAQEIGNRPVLIPTDDDSCLLVADHAEVLRAGFRFPSQPAGLARALSSKRTMHELCQRYGMPVAETSFPHSRTEVEAFASTARFPILVKGIDTLALQRRTGRKMALAHDASELLQHYDALEDPRVSAGTAGAEVEPSVMLQEYLPGGSSTLWMFDGYFGAGSRALFGLTGQKIREYPAYTGRTSLGVCQPNPMVAAQTIAFMQALGYRGAIDLDYKYDERTGEYKLIDVNPRLGATFRLFVDTVGMDVVRAQYLDLTGQPVVMGEPQAGRKWLVENFEALCVPTYLRQERLGLSGWLRSYHGLAETCWFALDDPVPFLALVPQAARWALAKRSGSGPAHHERVWPEPRRLTRGARVTYEPGSSIAPPKQGYSRTQYKENTMAETSMDQPAATINSAMAPAESRGAQCASVAARTPTATQTLQFSVVDTAEDAAWEAFLEHTPGGSYYQSSLWARSKAGLRWRAIRVIATTPDGATVGGAQLLVRKLPGIGALAFVHKGPVVADTAVVEPLLDQIHRVTRRLRVNYLNIQPPSGGEVIVDLLRARRYRPGLSGWGQAPATTVLDLTQDTEQIVQRMRKTQRSRLRRGQRLGVTVRTGTARDIEVFHRLLASTSRRQTFRTNSLEYYQQFWDTFAPSGGLQIFVAEYDEEPVSATLVICFGDTATSWKTGWSGQHGDKQPNMMLQWHAINWAKAHGYAYFDFLGLESDHALSWALVGGQVSLAEVLANPSFKLGFGGAIVTSPIAYEYVSNPILRHAYNFARDHASVWRLVNAAMPLAQGRAHR